MKYHADRAAIKNQNSILCYKETLGYPGHTRCHLTRTNKGVVQLLSNKERENINGQNFTSASEAMKHACDVCAERDDGDEKYVFERSMVGEREFVDGAGA